MAGSVFAPLLSFRVMRHGGNGGSKQPRPFCRATWSRRYGNPVCRGVEGRLPPAPLDPRPQYLPHDVRTSALLRLERPTAAGFRVTVHATDSSPLELLFCPGADPGSQVLDLLQSMSPSAHERNVFFAVDSDASVAHSAAP